MRTWPQGAHVHHSVPFHISLDVNFIILYLIKLFESFRKGLVRWFPMEDETLFYKVGRFRCTQDFPIFGYDNLK